MFNLQNRINKKVTRNFEKTKLENLEYNNNNNCSYIKITKQIIHVINTKYMIVMLII